MFSISVPTREGMNSVCKRVRGKINESLTKFKGNAGKYIKLS